MVTATAREVAVAPVTRTAGWLKAMSVKLSRPSGRSESYTGLIGFNLRRVKALKGDELPRNGSTSVYAKYSSSEVVFHEEALYQVYLPLYTFYLLPLIAYSC